MAETPAVVIVGGGLAGCEASWQLAQRGIAVTLLEMKPERFSEAHKSVGLAELVCSNSFRSASLTNAVGLLKEELRQLGSLNFSVAEEVKVPAGDALAVDRERFSAEITRRVEAHPLVTLQRQEVLALPEARPALVATGPLTGDALAEAIRSKTGSDSLYFYDAISPIIEADSIDMSQAFFASRYGKGSPTDYLNCPLDREGYYRFVDSVLAAEKVPGRPFEEPKFFPGCLPIEVMAESGRDTLSFGPMKPVGLSDPRSDVRPFAVVQLRRENRDGTAYNMVGFQTKLKWGEQKRLFRTIPGLENARFLRMGSVHRNTYLNGPRLLTQTLELKTEPGLYFAGQITGVEGYVESTAVGYLAALFIFHRLRGLEAPMPPATTALGALIQHVARGNLSGNYQPNNIHFGLFPDVEQDPLYRGRLAEAGRMKRGQKKRLKRQTYSDRALRDLAEWSAVLGNSGWLQNDHKLVVTT